MQWPHEILPERLWKLTELSLGQAAVDIQTYRHYRLPVQSYLGGIRPVDIFWYVLVHWSMILCP